MTKDVYLLLHLNLASFTFRRYYACSIGTIPHKSLIDEKQPISCSVLSHLKDRQQYFQPMAHGIASDCHFPRTADWQLLAEASGNSGGPVRLFQGLCYIPQVPHVFQPHVASHRRGEDEGIFVSSSAYPGSFLSHPENLAQEVGEHHIRRFCRQVLNQVAANRSQDADGWFDRVQEALC